MRVLVIGLITAIASEAAERSASCDSRRVAGAAAILSEHGNGNGPTLDLATADACELACCSDANAASSSLVGGCRAWSFTSATRRGACPHRGCCFLKRGPAASSSQFLAHCPNFVTGCLGFDCVLDPNHTTSRTCPSTPPPAPPTPSAPPLPYPFVVPSFGSVQVVIADVHGQGTLRDPTTVVFDPVGKRYHAFCTFVKGALGQGGYPGVIRHFSSTSLPASPPGDGSSGPSEWADGGIVLNASGMAGGAFDAAGVFTPAIVRECNPSNSSCTWYLFFGGVPNLGGAHAENVGLAIGTSPDGPFVRWSLEPVFNRTDSLTSWCGEGGAARVDEIKPTVVAGQKLFAVKCVCANFTALPVLYTPVDQGGGWAPPYMPAQDAPLFEASHTCDGKGFEEPTLFTAPDGFLHFIAHDHSSACPKYAHFVSRQRSLTTWERAPNFGGGNFLEPNPVPAAGDGVFGREIGPMWIDFKVAGWDKLVLTSVTWEWVRPNLTLH